MKRWIIPSLAALCLAGSVFFVASRSGTAPSAASPAGSFSGSSPASSGSTPAASVSTRVASSAAATSPQGASADTEAGLSSAAATRIAADPAARHPAASGPAASSSRGAPRTSSGGGLSASAGEPASPAVADAPPVEELAPLPVVFQLDPQSYINLGPGEDAIIAEAQREFSDAMAGAGAPDSAAYLKRWNRAQWDADNRLRQELGAIGFNRLASEAMGAAQAGK